MTIVHIITRLILGGAQEVVIRTGAEQVRDGHRVVLIHGPIYGPEGSLLEQANASGAEVEQLPTLVREVSPRRDYRAYRRLRQRIASLDPEVVHTHSSKAGILGRAAAWAQRVPCVVHTVHGLAFHDRQRPAIRRAFIQAERFAAKRCHQLIAVSPQMVRAFEANRIARAGKFTVIPSAVNLDRFEGADTPENARLGREALGIDSSAPVVGLLGRLDRLKGQHDLLEILPRLLEHVPDLHLVFVGDGFERSELDARVESELDSAQRQRVIFTGLVDPDRVRRVMPAVNLSVLPSYQEGQSLSLAESLLCGCGIVGYDTGGIPGICINERTGLLVRRGNKQALAEAIIRMLDDPEKRRRLTEAGKQHVRHTLDPLTMTRKIDRVYSSVLQRSA